ncbi:MAG: amino acid permease [Verrucomicrobiaceae bacterium]|nr:amino acid permease [Verrucomicrobiaceae bacterium]
MNAQSRRISLLTATAVVVANMVGTGVFASLGYQVGGLPSGFAILALWLVGGVCAFCGAVCYGELAAAMPRSGGEYHFLGRIFHPFVGFLAGWISVTVGFAAPIALAAMAFGKYLSGVFPGLPITLCSILMVTAVTLVHQCGVGVAARFQNTATWLKISLIIVFITAGFLFGEVQPVSFLPAEGDLGLIQSHSFAVSLVYVMYSYAGWNAATYIVGDIRDPQRNVPRAIALGTLLVTALYLLLNAVFLRVTPMAELKGTLDVGHVAADHIFGLTGGKIMSGLICLGLISCVSAMTWLGPRVLATMGQDVRSLAIFAKTSPQGTPTAGLIMQLLIVIVLIVTSTFEKVLTSVQFGLQLASFATVVGLIVLRVREPALARPYRCWGYPFTPLIFLIISAWMMFYIIRDKPQETAAGLLLLAVGAVIYLLGGKKAAAQ